MPVRCAGDAPVVILGDPMDSMYLRQFLDREPFRPINLVLADGSKVRVKSKEFTHLSPKGRTLIVYTGKAVGNQEEVKVIDTIMITQVETALKPGGVRLAKDGD